MRTVEKTKYVTLDIQTVELLIVAADLTTRSLQVGIDPEGVIQSAVSEATNQLGTTIECLHEKVLRSSRSR